MKVFLNTGIRHIGKRHVVRVYNVYTKEVEYDGSLVSEEYKSYISRYPELRKDKLIRK